MDKYWDVLSLHGAWNSPEDYRKIDARYNVASKPAMSTEWHAILQGSVRSDQILSETELSLKMMKDLLYQLKVGVTRILAFEMVNLTEKEALPYAAENRCVAHCSGLFRRLPKVEPRQPGVVLANFIEVVGKKAKYAKEFNLSDESIAVLLDTARGPVIAFWSETGPVSMQTISPYLQKDSLLRDWEGRQVIINSETKFQSKKLYYILSPNNNTLSKAAIADKLVYIRKASRSAQTVAKASFVATELFASVNAEKKVPDTAWITSDWKLTRLQPTLDDETFSVRAAVGANENAIDLVVEVKDKNHQQNEPQPFWWDGDSLQVAFDSEGAGFSGGNTEFICALTEKGSIIWKLIAAEPRGDLPNKWSPANGPAKFAEVKVFREGDTTRYQVRIPFSELFPMVFDPTKPIRISFAVNNNDGTGRAEYLEWGGGITKDKDPSLYGQLNLLVR